MALHIYHEDGLYFGLDEEEYHNDPALGSTDIKLLAGEPADYYHLRLDPLRPERPGDTPAKILGSAVHKLVLEGPSAFSALYERHPDPEGLLVTIDHMKAWLDDAGAKATRTDGSKGAPRKEDYVRRILEIDPGARILDAIKAAAQAAGRRILDAEDYDRVVASAQQIALDPSLCAAFQGGYPEVSVFWTEEHDGVQVRRKARFDRLKERAIVDLKSIGRLRTAPFWVNCVRALAEISYDVQAAAYMQARAAVRELIAAGRVHGDADPAFLEAVRGANQWAFVFVFWRSQGAALTYGCQLSPGSPILENGESIVAHALANYVRCVKQFGIDRPWIERLPLQELAIEQMPAWYGRVAA